MISIKSSVDLELQERYERAAVFLLPSWSQYAVSLRNKLLDVEQINGFRLFQVTEDEVVNSVPINPFFAKHLDWIKAANPMLGIGNREAILLSFDKPLQAFGLLWNKEIDEIANLWQERS